MEARPKTILQNGSLPIPSDVSPDVPIAIKRRVIPAESFPSADCAFVDSRYLEKGTTDSAEILFKSRELRERY